MDLYPRDLDGNPATIEGYYDPSLNITWQADVLSQHEFGILGWRLPVLDSSVPVFSYDGSTSLGYNVKAPSNELGHLFYVTLGNQGLCDVTGACTDYDPANTGLNTGPFIFPVKTFPLEWDHQNYDLVFRTSVLTDPNDSEGGPWVFSFETGYTNPLYGDYAVTIPWTVHDGDIGASLPVPASLMLLVSGLLLFSSLLKKRRVS